MNNLDFKTEDLPKFFQELLMATRTKREKDMLLLSTLGALGAVFHETTGDYYLDQSHANLFVLIFAPASSGKSVVLKSKKITREIDKLIKEESRLAKAKRDYEIEVYHKKIKKGSSGFIPKPEECKEGKFIIPGDSSAAALIDTLEANGGFGLICESEIEAIIKSFGKEWGDNENHYNCAFENEPLSTNRKGSGLIEIDKPRFSLVASGVPFNMSQFLKSVHSGLFSRSLIYVFRDVAPVGDLKPSKGRSIDDIAASLSADLLEFYMRYREVNIPFKMSNSMYEDLRKWVEDVRDWLKSNGGNDIIGYSNRYGNMVLRIAMILTLADHIYDDKLPSKFKCKSVHFNTAKSIVQSLLPHIMTVYSTIRKVEKNVPEHIMVYNAMQNRFTREEYHAKAKKQFGGSQRTFDTYIKMLKDEGVIKKKQVKGRFVKITEKEKGGEAPE